VLYVRVWREPDLSGPVSVSPDGRISLRFINEIQAAGQTPEQVAKNITKSLDRYMNHPEVNVQVAAVNSKKFFISVELLSRVTASRDYRITCWATRRSHRCCARSPAQTCM
jgi:polysaccharide export outer membrane protein